MTDDPDHEKKKLSILRGKRVLLLFPHLVTPGGALNYTLRLAEQLRERGVTVAVLTLLANQEIIEFPVGLEVISLNGPLTSSLRYWLLFPLWQRRISRAIAVWKPDVIVPQVFPANWWGWLYKRRHPIVRLAWVCQEPSAFIHSMAWIRALKPWWKSVLAKIMRPLLKTVDLSLAPYCDRIIANSRFTASEVQRLYGVTADGIAYPGIDFPPPPDRKRPRARALITVARLTKFKRIDFLLEVFQRLLTIHPDLHFNIVGTGEDEAFLRNRVKNLGLRQRVVFHGTLDAAALTDLYRNSVLFLHGSIGEPFGLAPLEAIACGTPVVGHCSGGLQEFVHENCGRLIASQDIEVWAGEIAEYLDFLAGHPDFFEQVSAGARRFEWRYSLRPALEVIAGICPVPGRHPSQDTHRKK
jgi:glycosyltransferase involved in cell wall biosynthesis